VKFHRPVDEFIKRFWLAYESIFVLGDALLGQAKYQEAEWVWLQACASLKNRGVPLTADRKRIRLDAISVRLVKLYQNWGKSDEAEKWRGEMSLDPRQ
jgi:hypothetical protein